MLVGHKTLGRVHRIEERHFSAWCRQAISRCILEVPYGYSIRLQQQKKTIGETGV
jgi:hypothetical protein